MIKRFICGLCFLAFLCTAAALCLVFLSCHVFDKTALDLDLTNGFLFVEKKSNSAFLNDRAFNKKNLNESFALGSAFDMENFAITAIFTAKTLFLPPAHAAGVSYITDKETREVEQFFNSYVDSANNYRDDLADKYIKDAKIKRVVIKPDGTKQTIEIPMERYLKELKSGKKTARLVNYKNTYTNKKYSKTGENEYKIKTTRIPFRDKTGLNAQFTVIRTPKGLKIAEELMETTVQRFLTEK